MNTTKYEGIIPAFYACYDAEGKVAPEAVRALTKWFIDKDVKGLYVGGSSGECIYQSKEERKTVLENVMAEAKGKLTIIAHVACNNTADSQELAAHAESLGVDAIASIPPIYFHLPPYAIAKYWNDISGAAPNTDFIIYNIPQLAGVALSVPLLKEMLKNPRCIGVKNSSMPTQDIQMWRNEGAIVFNGPDEQLISGLVMGAAGGIGGTYGAMVELFINCTILGIKLCMPILAAALIAQVGMGVLMKVIPQINVFAINIELKVIIGLTLLLLLLAPFSEYLLAAENEMLLQIQRLLLEMG